ncbi:PIN domain-containing protein [Rubrobacter tropicus]|uniref:PIN domain-containing protein n=1 Tax=Rubrobacter tropicus TaxID=2653851 RepID=A0A6G8Q5H4_9ACTN|nr:type II toxin-antitoxin system VapC family toxin [Rubrobacter tropicus]QIN81693.1 PIN domain-containing protein [Rubrobacter tropicus]
MSEVVLDASALLALLQQERGHEEVARVVPSAAMGAVNLSEVAAKLADAGMPEETIREAVGGLGLDIRDFDRELAFRAGMLRPLTKSRGLSLADRACLALGRQLELPVLTTDGAWKDLDLEVEVRLVRPRSQTNK